jgi:hypothetical protein
MGVQVGNGSYRYKRRRQEALSPPSPRRYREEPIDVERLLIEDRLDLINRYAASHPGDPVGDIVLELFPELQRLREQRRGLTRWSSYIGDLDDPAFQWDDPAERLDTQQLPRRLIPRAHCESIGISVFTLMEQSRNGVPDCRKLDWGAWGWKLTGQELMEFFGPKHRHAAAIAGLDAKRYYVLVAAEGI